MQYKSLMPVFMALFGVMMGCGVVWGQLTGTATGNSGKTEPGTGWGHPLIPDTIADPSIVEMNGNFYCYATTDTWPDAGRFRRPVVWISKDFLNWSFKGSLFPDSFDAEYWAPSTLLSKKGRYYLFPTLDHRITEVVADSPMGPFRALDGKDITRKSPAKPFLEGRPIDAEVFVDDDGQAYMVWKMRGFCKLNKEWTAPEGGQTLVTTKRAGYSEGPFLFKRKGIYYYLYTLEAHERYIYAYMMSRTSIMGPWEAPKDDIITRTDRARKIYGPGHGCAFNLKDTDQWFFVYLEYGRGGSSRQVWADKMCFNEDGTIQPVTLTQEGIGALRPVANPAPNLALGKTATASSARPDYKVPYRNDPTFDRTETYVPTNAVDGSNGTSWLADKGDATPWFQVDLGAVWKIGRTEAYFVAPTDGHAYRLESSLDGKNWQPYGGQSQVIIQSPHEDVRSVSARYLRLAILKGVPGLWEFRVYGR